MKDRMIIIREGVLFIITVTHDQKQKPEEEKTETTTNTDQKDEELPYLPISAN